MKCFRCAQENPPQAKFCFECAAPLQLSNPAPAAYLPPHLAEKIRAGRVALEGERKRVSVMFADVEDSMSLLAGRDPEEARVLLDGVLERMMEAVHRYEGTVNQIMGDGIMALFGAPVAHEDHALRACYAALRTQEAIGRFAAEVQALAGSTILVRIGINSGEVLVRSIAGDLHMDYTAIGETTHLAAKIEQIAEPGSIYVTSQVMRLVEGYIQARPLPPRLIKGLPARIDLFEVTGSGPLRTRFQVATRRGLSRFVGRHTETGALERAASMTRNAKGHVVVVVGQPGVGKSRLVWEFTQERRHSGWSVLKANTTSHGEGVAYRLVIDLLARYFDIAPGEERSRIADKIKRRLAALDEKLLAHLVPLGALFDVPAGNPRWDALDPPQRHRRTLDAVCALFVRESRETPLILVIEDLHAIDAESLELLDAIAGSLASERLMLLVEHRPEFKHDWREESRPVRIDVEPLAAANVAELFRNLMGDDASLVPLERLVLERTEGNPFFIEESLRSLVDTRALEPAPGGYRLARPVEAIEIPATVQDILSARVDRLAEREKALLQAAAVVGRDVSYEVLERVAGLDEEELSAGLAELVGAEFLSETSPYPTPEFSFKHSFTHQVAYSSLLQNRRKGLHALIMNTLEALYADRLGGHVERLAHHAARGEQWLPAMQYLRQAARRATERSANSDAIRHLEEAIRILPHLPRDRQSAELAIDLRLDLRNPLVARGSFGRIIPVLREAEALAEALDDDLRRARVAAYVAGYYWLAGQHEAAVESGESALRKAAPTAEFAVLVTTRFYVGASRHAMAEYAPALEILGTNIASLEGPRAFERFGMAGPPSVLSRSIRAWSQSELGQFGPALAEAEEALSIAESAAHPFSILTSSFVIAVIRLGRGDLPDAIRILEQGLALSRAERMRIWYPAFAILLAQAIALSGKAATAVPMIQKAIPVPSDAIYFAPFAVVAASEVYLLAGDMGESGRFGTRALELAKRKRERGYEAWALRVLGELAAKREPADVQVAEAYFRDALARSSALGMRPLAGRCQLGLAQLYRDAGSRGQFQEAISRAAALFEEMGMRFWLQRAREL